jgi:hypothetical protein
MANIIITKFVQEGLDEYKTELTSTINQVDKLSKSEQSLNSELKKNKCYHRFGYEKHNRKYHCNKTSKCINRGTCKGRKGTTKGANDSRNLHRWINKKTSRVKRKNKFYWRSFTEINISW